MRKKTGETVPLYFPPDTIEILEIVTAVARDKYMSRSEFIRELITQDKDVIKTRRALHSNRPAAALTELEKMLL